MAVLDRLLIPERERRQADTKTATGFALPFLCVRQVEEDEAPFVASNMRCGFVLTRRSVATGQVRFGLSECPLEDEAVFLRAMFEGLWSLSVEHCWSNRTSTLGEARSLLEGFGFEPRTIVVSPEALVGMSLEPKVRQEILQRGFAEVDGAQVLLADLPGQRAIVATVPLLVGVCTRVDVQLGVLIIHADRALVLVDHEMAGESR